MRAEQEKRKSMGLCIRCSEPRGNDGSRTFCRPCADKHNAACGKKPLHLCFDCRVPLEQHHGRRCTSCADKSNQNMKQRVIRYKEESRCVMCGSGEPVTTGKHLRCKTCYFRQTAKQNLGSASRWQELENLWDRQQGICPYTGRQLQIGVDASLDHINPTSRFPECATEIRNVEWVYYRVNEMKKDWTKEEFIQFMRDILMRF